MSLYLMPFNTCFVSRGILGAWFFHCFCLFMRGNPPSWSFPLLTQAKKSKFPEWKRCKTTLFHWLTCFFPSNIKIGGKYLWKITPTVIGACKIPLLIHSMQRDEVFAAKFHSEQNVPLLVWLLFSFTAYLWLSSPRAEDEADSKTYTFYK